MGRSSHGAHVDASAIVQQLFRGELSVSVASASTTQHFDVLTVSVAVSERVHVGVEAFVVHHVVFVGVQDLVQT